MSDEALIGLKGCNKQIEYWANKSQQKGEKLKKIDKITYEALVDHYDNRGPINYPLVKKLEEIKKICEEEEV